MSVEYSATNVKSLLHHLTIVDEHAERYQELDFGDNWRKTESSGHDRTEAFMNSSSKTSLAQQMYKIKT